MTDQLPYKHQTLLQSEFKKGLRLKVVWEVGAVLLADATPSIERDGGDYPPQLAEMDIGMAVQYVQLPNGSTLPDCLPELAAGIQANLQALGYEDAVVRPVVKRRQGLSWREEIYTPREHS